MLGGGSLGRACKRGKSMLNRLVIGMAGLACGILLTLPSRPGQGVSLVNVTGGIGLSLPALPCCE